MAVVNLTAHAGVKKEQEAPTLKHLASMASQTIFENHVGWLVPLGDMTNTQRSCGRRENFAFRSAWARPLSRRVKPDFSLSEPSFQKGIGIREFQSSEAVLADGLFQRLAQLRNSTSSGITPVREKPVPNYCAERQGAQKFTNVGLAAQDSGQFQTVSFQILEEARGPLPHSGPQGIPPRDCPW